MTTLSSDDKYKLRKLMNQKYTKFTEVRNKIADEYLSGRKDIAKERIIINKIINKSDTDKKLLEHLQSLGVRYQVRQKVAKQIIEECKSKGLSLEQIKRNLKIDKRMKMRQEAGGGGSSKSFAANIKSGRGGTPEDRRRQRTEERYEKTRGKAEDIGAATTSQKSAESGFVLGNGQAGGASANINNNNKAGYFNGPQTSGGANNGISSGFSSSSGPMRT